jgi:hypothetical protein
MLQFEIRSKQQFYLPMKQANEMAGGKLSGTEEERSGRRGRRMYKITTSSRRALKTAKLRVREFFGELVEGK